MKKEINRKIMINEVNDRCIIKIDYIEMKSGAAYVAKYKNNHYLIKINQKYDKIIQNLLLYHELAHIYLFHHENNEKHNMELIKLAKLRNIKINDSDLPSLMNVVDDIEINDRLYSDEELKSLTDNDLKPFLSESLDLPKFSPRMKVYIKVLEKYNENKNKLKELFEKLKDVIFKDLSVEEMPNNYNPLPDLSDLLNDITITTTEDDSVVTQNNVHCSISKYEALPYVETTDGKLLKYILMNLSQVFTVDHRIDRFRNMYFDKSELLSYTLIRSQLNTYHPYLVVILDVSGSMNQTIVEKATATIKSLSNNNVIDERSLMIYCNSMVTKVQKIKYISDTPKKGGGTELHFAFTHEYIPVECDQIFLITDLETNINLLKEYFNKLKGKRKLNVISYGKMPYIKKALEVGLITNRNYVLL